MAKAKAGKRQTTRKVTLTLTEGEADLILALVSMSGGSRSKSPAKYARRIRRALMDVLGYNELDTDAFHLGLGHVEFFDYDNHPDITLSQRTMAMLNSDGLQLHAEFDPEVAGSLSFAEEMANFFELVAEGMERDEVSS